MIPKVVVVSTGEQIAVSLLHVNPAYSRVTFGPEYELLFFLQN